MNGNEIVRSMLITQQPLRMLDANDTAEVLGEWLSEASSAFKERRWLDYMLDGVSLTGDITACVLMEGISSDTFEDAGMLVRLEYSGKPVAAMHVINVYGVRGEVVMLNAENARTLLSDALECIGSWAMRGMIKLGIEHDSVNDLVLLRAGPDVSVHEGALRQLAMNLLVSVEAEKRRSSHSIFLREDGQLLSCDYEGTYTNCTGQQAVDKFMHTATSLVSCVNDLVEYGKPHFLGTDNILMHARGVEIMWEGRVDRCQSHRLHDGYVTNFTVLAGEDRGAAFLRNAQSLADKAVANIP